MSLLSSPLTFGLSPALDEPLRTANRGARMYHLICPICGDDLQSADRAYRCARGHSFDIAREGYVNLLRSRSRKPEIMGDSLSMLHARREFLDRGHYAPLSKLISEAVDEHLANFSDREGCVAEIGCGEGYYIGQVRSLLEGRGKKGLRYFGMDRSRDAVRMAAKRYRGITFFVADVWEKVLFRDRSVRVLLDIFAPRNPDEFARVLEPGGILLVVIPGAEHLAEARRELGLIGMETGKEERAMERLSRDFHLARRRTLEYEMHLESPEVRALAEMTPGSRHVAPERLDCIPQEGMRVTASFIVLELVRRGPT